VSLDAPLIQHLQAVTGLEAGLLAKILAEVRAWHSRDLQSWVRDRHQELQRQGLSNREILPRLCTEAREVLVRPGRLSERQVRRMVYG
jgi:hypothetical protein